MSPHLAKTEHFPLDPREIGAPYQQKAIEGMVETITHNNEILALILRASFSESGVHFLTPDEFSQQLGYMRHPKGKVIEPHIHNETLRTITLTQEVLFIRKGKLRVDFYDKRQSYLESRVLSAGDVILLSAGGHGFEALEELEMIEVKQGPYVGVADKTRFKPAPHDIKLGQDTQA